MAEAVATYDADLPVLGLPGSVWLQVASESRLRTVTEAFADRAYTPQGTLVSRREPGAVLDDVEQVTRRCVAMAAGDPVTDIEGGEITVSADSICVHGDTPGAVEVARSVRDALAEAGVDLRAFAS